MKKLMVAGSLLALALKAQTSQQNQTIVQPQPAPQADCGKPSDIDNHVRISNKVKGHALGLLHKYVGIDVNPNDVTLGNAKRLVKNCQAQPTGQVVKQ